MSRRRANNRTAVTTLETAFLLPILLLVLLTMLDLGLASVRHSALTSAARVLVREASFRSADAPAPLTAWGPATMAGNAGDGSAASLFVRNRLPTMTAADVDYQLQWIDPAVGARGRVQATLTFRHQPLLASLTPWGAIDIVAAAHATQLN